MAEDAGYNTRAATRTNRTRGSSCGASDFVEEDVAVALEMTATRFLERRR